jgi:hypothetical protein
MCSQSSVLLAASICICVDLYGAIYMCESVWEGRSVCGSSAPVCVGVVNVYMSLECVVWGVCGRRLTTAVCTVLEVL